MIPIPEVNDVDVAFGNIDHLPARQDLPEEYQRQWHHSDHPYCSAISEWFYRGATMNGKQLIIAGRTFVPKEGVDFDKAVRALRAIMCSWKPKHEHKIGGCGYLLSEWFEVKS